MKFRKSLILLLLLPFFINANTLSKNEIMTLGMQAFHLKAQSLCPDALSYSLKHCQYLESDGVVDLAILHFDTGFLIFSAEDAVFPVLAYSFTNDVDVDNPACGVNLFLTQYRQEIAAARLKQSVPSERVKQAWEELRHPSIRGTTTEIVVSPLLHSNWNQSKYYNYYCPQDANAPSGYDGRVPNGCVAVAMSQIIFYYRYPESGSGNHTNHSDYGNFHVNFAQQHYNYDVMCDNLNFYNHEVAKLIFHCGTAVDMMYGPDGSGAYSHDVPDAMSTYFKYNTDSYYASKHYFSDSTWHTLLINDLNARRPIYYSGYSTDGGHAFVCDGYNSDEYFHFNFGWGGSGNGYYLTQSTDSDDNEVGGFGFGQSAILNLHPIEHVYPTYCNNRVITAANGSLDDGSGNLNYLDDSYCTYVITDPRQYAVYVTLKKCSTQENHDFIRFWNGDPSQDSLLLEISGHIPNSTTYTFNTDSLFITFVSDDSITSEGWYLTFESLREGIGCGTHVIRDPYGVISDNSGDDNYRDNMSCSWTFRINNVETLTFNFEELNISPEDHLDFYDISTFPAELIVSYSGNTLPEPLIYHSGKVRIKFISDNYLNDSGFRLTWSADGTGIDNRDIPVSVYPNPASETIHVTFARSMEDGEVAVRNIIGKTIFTQSFSNTESITFPVHQLPEGIYILSITSGKDTFHKKIIVKH